jgi:hypothetical protein
LIDFAANLFESRLEIFAGAAVAVPVRVIKLHEAHAALDEPAREQTIARE